MATALLVLGADAGHPLAEKLGLAVLFQRRTDEGIVRQPTSRFIALPKAN
jgi:thiamine biosynthesis lipoprotein ApbE